MKIGLLNVDSVLNEELKSRTGILDLENVPVAEIPQLQGIFVSWLNRESSNAKALLHQTNVMEKALEKKIKLLIFDSTFDLTTKEISFLRKNGAVIFEPALRTRKGCNYLPFWVNIPKDVPLFPGKKYIDLAFIGDQKNIEDEYAKYYSNLTSLFPSLVLEEAETYAPVKCTILIGTEKEYICGYLPQINSMLEQSCIPLLPHKHRFYHSLFKNLVLFKEKDIKFIIDSYDLMDYGLIHDIYSRIRKYFPEMTVENVATKIIQTIRG